MAQSMCLALENKVINIINICSIIIYPTANHIAPFMFMQFQVHTL